MSFLVLFSKY